MDLNYKIQIFIYTDWMLFSQVVDLILLMHVFFIHIIKLSFIKSGLDKIVLKISGQFFIMDRKNMVELYGFNIINHKKQYYRCHLDGFIMFQQKKLLDIN